MKFKLLIAMAVLGSAGMNAAHAVPTAWTAEFDPPDVFLNSAASTEAGRSLSFTLDLRSGPNGFRPGIDTIDDAILNVVLFDDLDLSKEKVSFRFDGGGLTSPATLIGGGFFPDLFVFSPLAFLNDGVLNLTVKATQGDFLFDNAFLAAFGDRAEVPEPASAALIGLGLLGMGWTIRRRSVAVKR